jgi:putative redox protein
MEIVVDHLGDVQFEVKARNHTLICDQPEENGGFNEGMTPPEFMLASLGSCAAYYAVQYLKARQLAAQGLRVRVTAGKGKAPARLVDFKIEVQLPRFLEERHKEGVLRAVHSCLIHNTLLDPPQITTVLVQPLAA